MLYILISKTRFTKSKIGGEVLKEKMSSKLIEVARTWIDTPWMHHQRVKGIGVDCVGFLFAVAQESGYDLPPMPKNYNRTAISDDIRNYLNNNLLPTDVLDEGTILLFQYAGYNNHVGIATSKESVIHASSSHKRVVEHPLDGVWLRTLKGMWILP